MSTNEALLVPRRERNWRMGLTYMLSKELAAWWKTRRWWVQCLVALLLLNGNLAVNLRGGRGTPNAVENATTAFMVTAALCVPLAAVSLAQDSILGEKHSGTAAWVLSKPLRRPAYVLAKVIAYGVGLFVAWVVLPGVVVYLQLLKPAHGYFTPLRSLRDGHPVLAGTADHGPSGDARRRFRGGQGDRIFRQWALRLARDGLRRL